MRSRTARSRRSRFFLGPCCAVLLAAWGAPAQTPAPLTWAQVQRRFEQNNPTLQAGATGIRESRAEEVSAYLRPNPNLTLSEDGTQIGPNNGVWVPLTGTYEVAQLSYLHERDHKRELRLKSAQAGTAVAISDQADLQRTLLFNLRTAFVDTLEAKAVLQLAQDNLSYWDRVLGVSRDRLRVGDISGLVLVRLDKVQRGTTGGTAERPPISCRSDRAHDERKSSRWHRWHALGG